MLGFTIFGFIHLLPTYFDFCFCGGFSFFEKEKTKLDRQGGEEDLGVAGGGGIIKIYESKTFNKKRNYQKKERYCSQIEKAQYSKNVNFLQTDRHI